MSLRCVPPVCDHRPSANALALREQVKSRSSDEECVVAQLDQWYLEYGEASWRAAVEAHMHSGHFETFDPLVAKQFDEAVAWLSQWACSRWFGLGTKLPWDQQFVIESLSDSTIYMYGVGRMWHALAVVGSVCPRLPCVSVCVSRRPACPLVRPTCG
jgi:hypothetical protein